MRDRQRWALAVFGAAIAVLAAAYLLFPYVAPQTWIRGCYTQFEGSLTQKEKNGVLTTTEDHTARKKHPCLPGPDAVRILRVDDHLAVTDLSSGKVVLEKQLPDIYKAKSQPSAAGGPGTAGASPGH